MGTVPTIPTRAELRAALDDHSRAERAWRTWIDDERESLLYGTPRPGGDVVELDTACRAAWAALLDLADRLPEVSS